MSRLRWPPFPAKGQCPFPPHFLPAVHTTFDLNGRKAVVTGATGGIGEAIARSLHARGAAVGLLGRRVEKLEALASEFGDRVKIFPANLSNRDEVKALGQKAEADLEGVDILVNNARITKDGSFVRMS